MLSPIPPAISSTTPLTIQELSPTPPVSQAMLNTSLTTKVFIATKSNATPSCSIPKTSDEDLLTSGEISQIFLKSCSRKNFATLLVRRLFPEEIRKVSNVSGKDKKQLDPKVMKYIKETTFEHWSLAQTEKVNKEWSECKIVIDKANRRLNRAAKKN